MQDAAPALLCIPDIQIAACCAAPEPTPHLLVGCPQLACSSDGVKQGQQLRLAVGEVKVRAAHAGVDQLQFQAWREAHQIMSGHGMHFAAPSPRNQQPLIPDLHAARSGG